MARKRTSIPITPREKTAEIIKISIDDMIATDNTGARFHLKRLRYKGVPKMHLGTDSAGRFSADAILTNAGRDDFIRGIYRSLSSNSTRLYGVCRKLVPYFRYLDAKNYSGDILDLTVMSGSIKHFNEQALIGITPSWASAVRRGLSASLEALGKGNLKHKLPRAHNAGTQGVHGGALDIETELKPIARILRRGFECFVGHIRAGTTPDIHPFFNKEQLEKRAEVEGWSKSRLARKLEGYTSCLKLANAKASDPIDPRVVCNHAVGAAITLHYMLTGMNTGVLAKITYEDVAFKGIGAGRYVISGLKNRAGHKIVDNAIGFSKRTKGIIEDWMVVSKIMYKNLGHEVTEKSLVFPCFLLNGEIVDRTDNRCQKTAVNRRITPLVGFKVNASRFRKTKADILIRATEDIYIVSEALNNKIDVVKRHYSRGVKSDHDRNLRATGDAQMSIARGKGIAEAVKAAKALHSDILDSYQYKQGVRRGEIPEATLTPTGFRCAGASKEKMKQESKKAEKFGSTLPIEEGKCVDFFGCFDCPSQRIVAGEMEIWMMLSFQYQVLELKELIAVSSSPHRDLYEKEILTNKTLSRIEVASPIEYKKAIAMLNKKGLHPLYRDRRTLKYFMGEYE
jgi:hypothetical protein